MKTIKIIHVRCLRNPVNLVAEVTRDGWSQKAGNGTGKEY
jgi:hypothetical protein